MWQNWPKKCKIQAVTNMTTISTKDAKLIKRQFRTKIATKYVKLSKKQFVAKMVKKCNRQWQNNATKYTKLSKKAVFRKNGHKFAK